MDRDLAQAADRWATTGGGLLELLKLVNERRRNPLSQAARGARIALYLHTTHGNEAAETFVSCLDGMYKLFASTEAEDGI